MLGKRYELAGSKGNFKVGHLERGWIKAVEIKGVRNGQKMRDFEKKN